MPNAGDEFGSTRVPGSGILVNVHSVLRDETNACANHQFRPSPSSGQRVAMSQLPSVHGFYFRHYHATARSYSPPRRAVILLKVR